MNDRVSDRMIRHKVVLLIDIADDDQSDDVTIVEVLEHWIRTCVDKDSAENGIRWPLRWTVFHQMQHYIPEPDKVTSIEHMVTRCVREHGGFAHGRASGFCNACKNALKEESSEKPNQAADQEQP